MIEIGDKPDWKCVFTYIQSLYISEILQQVKTRKSFIQILDQKTFLCSKNIIYRIMLMRM
jgi:hypothetical protein